MVLPHVQILNAQITLLIFLITIVVLVINPYANTVQFYLLLFVFNHFSTIIFRHYLLQHKGHTITTLSSIREKHEDKIQTAKQDMKLRLKDISALFDVISSEEQNILDEKEQILKQIDTAASKMKEVVESRSSTLINRLMRKRKDTVEQEKQKLEREMKNIQALLKKECDKSLVEKSDDYVAQTVTVCFGSIIYHAHIRFHFSLSFLTSGHC